MKKMSLYFLALLAGLALCGWLVRRHQKRVPAPMDLRPVDAWQGSIKLDRGGTYTPDEAARKRLLEKLQAEEERQRPQERRN
ncbi:MAG: hypothetical protein U1F61_08750 [Opitutaceae bacterium]|jgi:hypothetical protein